MNKEGFFKDFIYGSYIDEGVCDQLTNEHRQCKNKVYDNERNYTKCVLSCDKVRLNYVIELEKCLEKYKQHYKFVSEKFEGPYGFEDYVSIQEYKPGECYRPLHSEKDARDTTYGIYRHLVFMTYLNDVDDGGETFFYYQNFKCKPRKGLTLIWPAQWTHVHCGLPAHKEYKMIATGCIIFNSAPGYTIVSSNSLKIRSQGSYS